ncbi:hypothetical protein [Zunongwangia sp. HRR-M8]|uniref:hypothetical protein n=1 Tax=Zunongwangia sp. HRR-M8 TaxID=3015170 RepID=UPI0022DD62AC|nr:hypothetical protein [Zunongwangia sp. HRR-M8]WBL21818.1 hypothetical protein PBT89_13965 [Zunongwangia sp. HRR-M8]
MKTIIIYFAFLLSSFAIGSLEAQEEREQKEFNLDSVARVREIKEQKIKIATQEEKDRLKKEIEKINKDLESGWYEKEEAEKKKKEAAKLAAENIRNRIAIIENEVDIAERNREPGTYLELKLSKGKINLGIDKPEKDQRIEEKRTKNDFVIAFGFNNALADGQSINDSDFKLAGSRFFEIGWAWTTRVFENTNWLRIKYGLSFQLNGLKPTDNRYFVQDGDVTRLEEFEFDFDKSKFRMDNLVVPIHFEIGPYANRSTDGHRRFSTEDQIKVGFGGYAGFNIGERQKLKFNDGDDQKIKDKSSFNTNEFVYGLSGYLSFGGTALYAKYDLNPIFSSPNTEIHNFSLGLRLDID